MGQVENSIIGLGVFYDKIRAWFARMGVVVSGGLTGVLSATTEVEATYSMVWKASGVRGSADGGSWLHPYNARHGSVSCSGKTAISIVVPQSGQAEWQQGSKAIGSCVVSADSREWSVVLNNVAANTAVSIKGGMLLSVVDSSGNVVISEAGNYAVVGENGMVCVTKVSSNA